MSTTAQIQEIYVGLLGRAADADGLAYWTAEIDGGVLTIEQLRANIVNEQPEYEANLGSLTRVALVEALYENLFERAPEAEGLTYWTTGGGSTVNADQLVLALSNGASAADRAALDNKTEAATYYTNNAPVYVEAEAEAAVADVDTAASLLDSKAATDVLAASQLAVTAVSSSVDEGANAQFSVTGGLGLTTYDYTVSGVDADDVLGGTLSGTVTTDSSGNATINVGILEDNTTEGTDSVVVTLNGRTASTLINDTSVTRSGASVSLTTSRDILNTQLTTGDDTITGGFGTFAAADLILDTSTTDDDVANLTVATNIAGTISNIETVNIDLREASSGTVNATNFSGIGVINVDSNYGAATFTVNEMSSGTVVGFDKTATAINLDMYLASGATASKTDAATVVLSGDVTASLDKGGTEAADVDVLTIQSNGTKKNTITLDETDDYIAANSTESDSIIVTGDQDLVLIVGQETNAKGLDGATLTNQLTGGATLTIQLTNDDQANDDDLVGAEIDLDSVDGIIKLMEEVDVGDATDLKLKDGATVQTGAATLLTGTLTMTSATAGGTLNLEFGHADATGDEDVVFKDAAVVNVTGTASSAIDTGANLKTNYAGLGNSVDLNIAVGEGLTFGSIVAAAGTLDAITVTGTGDKDLTAVAVTANSFTMNTGGDLTLSDALTTSGDISINVGKNVSLEEVQMSAAAAGTITITTAGDVSLTEGVGDGTNDVGTITISAEDIATSATNANIDTDGDYTLTASKTINIGDSADAAAVGDITLTAGTTVEVDGDLVSATGDVTVVAGTTVTGEDNGAFTATAGSVSITAGTTNTIAAAISAADNVTLSGTVLDLKAVTGTAGTVSLTGSSSTTNSTIGGTVTGNSIVFNGSGHTFAGANADIDLVGAVTIQGGASLDFDANAGNLVNGNVTHTGSGTVAIKDLAGTYSGATATGAVTIADTAAGASAITTGSGDDSVTTGDVSGSISTGAGNDTINAAGITTDTKQVVINAGAGVDTITGGAHKEDILTGGAGTDTFRFLNDDNSGASEVITDFQTGSAGDILGMDISAIDSIGSALDSDMATVVLVDTTDDSTTAHDKTDVYVLNGETFANENAMIAAMNDATTGITGTFVDTEQVLVVWAKTDGNAYVTVVDSDGTTDFNDANEVTLVKLTGLGISELSGFTADNFSSI